MQLGILSALMKKVFLMISNSKSNSGKELRRLPQADKLSVQGKGGRKTETYFTEHTFGLCAMFVYYLFKTRKYKRGSYK